MFDRDRLAISILKSRVKKLISRLRLRSYIDSSGPKYLVMNLQTSEVFEIYPETQSWLFSEKITHDDYERQVGRLLTSFEVEQLQRYFEQFKHSYLQGIAEIVFNEFTKSPTVNISDLPKLKSGFDRKIYWYQIELLRTELESMGCFITIRRLPKDKKGKSIIIVPAFIKMERVLKLN